MQVESTTPETSARPPSRRRLISADRVQGTPVFDHHGGKIGHIEDVMLHKESGRVAYAIMSHGGFLGAGARYHPVPWSILHYDMNRAGYVLPVDRNQLDNAPTLGKEDLENEDDSWEAAVHSHYGMPAPFI